MHIKHQQGLNNVGRQDQNVSSRPEFEQATEAQSKNLLDAKLRDVKAPLSQALNTAARNSGHATAKPTVFFKDLSELCEHDIKAIEHVVHRDGQYLVEEGQYMRSGNTFRITDGPLSGYKLIYKGGRNFQLRNSEGQSLVMYHAPHRRPRIAPSNNYVAG